MRGWDSDSFCRFLSSSGLGGEGRGSSVGDIAIGSAACAADVSKVWFKLIPLDNDPRE
jgi:hypothetical protein